VRETLRRRPVYELSSKLLLELFYRDRQARLHDVHLSRGRGELPLFGQRDELLKVSDVHLSRLFIITDDK
jgi:hypothetical protein